MTRTTRTARALLIATIFAALAAIALTGCASNSGSSSATPAATSANAAGFPVTITDDASRSITVKAEPKRIVSLAPANTEILFALGLGSEVVGVTSYDDYPSQVASITKVGDFAGPNIEAVAAAKPDLILATSGVQADVVKKLEALGATVVVLDPQSLPGVYADIERVGKVTGSSDKASTLLDGMKADIQSIEAAVAASPTVSTFIEIGQNPLFTAGQGTLMDELITLAGGTNVVTQPGYVSFSSEQLIKANPSVYLATKGSSSDPSSIERRPGYSAISAIKNNRVVILDDSIVSRGGPRIVEGLKAIALALHPGIQLH
ncbi:MAG: ABC transporter substrate-binding protein [Coriobacteriia bacterium]|nr:ABC transporter substrate-binding protein [Coriobacteriia bacterium]